jgi:c-di-GMP-binding flagellar brake protein YcgR
MERINGERRETRRYQVHLSIQYRVSRRGALPCTGSGTTRDMSTTGLSFRCRRALPVGSHIELNIEWPARHEDAYPIDLQLTGFVIRSDSGRTAVRITSHRFRIAEMPAEPYRASA